MREHKIYMKKKKQNAEVISAEEFCTYLSYLLGLYMAKGLMDDYPKNFNKIMPEFAQAAYEIFTKPQYKVKTFSRHLHRAIHTN